MPLQIRRGSNAERASMSTALAEGELLYTTDSKKLYIGDGSTLGGIVITGFTTEDAQDATAALFAAGTHTNITFTYDDTTNSLSASVDLSSIPGYGDVIVADAVKGSVFADDSSLMVDGVSGLIVGTLAETMNMDGGAIIDSAEGNFEVRNLNNFNIEANGVVNIYTDAQGVGYQWQFGDDGSLSTPGQLSIGGQTYTSSGIIWENGTGAVINNNAIEEYFIIATNTDSGTEHDWTFGYDGIFTAPGDITTTGNITGSVITGTSVETPTITTPDSSTLTIVPTALFSSDVSVDGQVSARDGVLANIYGYGNRIIYNLDTQELNAQTISTGLPTVESPRISITGNIITTSGGGATGAGLTILCQEPEGALILGDGVLGNSGRMKMIINRDSAEYFGDGFVYQQHHDTADSVNFAFYRTRGTFSAPTAVQSGDELNEFVFYGQTTTSRKYAATFKTVVTGTPTSVGVPSKFTFRASNGVANNDICDITPEGLNVDAIGTLSTDAVSMSSPLIPKTYANTTARDADITSPSAGMLIFVVDGDGGGNPKFQGYTGSAWVNLN